MMMPYTNTMHPLGDKSDCAIDGYNTNEFLSLLYIKTSVKWDKNTLMADSQKNELFNVS